MKEYIKLNKATWDNKTESHYESDFYDVKGFIAGKSSLNQIEIDLLGDFNGKTLLHLQCHFGQDTISLERLGAKVTGVDFSPKSIEKARELANLCNSNAEFILSDVLELNGKIAEKFDIVFASYGTIGWLENLDKWAEVVNYHLKSNGKFVFVEFHPFIWMFDDDLKHFKYSYFNDEEIAEEYEGSYTDSSEKVKNKTISFNHNLAEVIQALINKGLKLEVFQEYNYSPYNIFPGMKEYEKGKFQIEKFGSKIPLVYSLVFEKTK